MGACISTGMIEVSEDDKRKHKEVEKELKEVSAFRRGIRNVKVDPGHSFRQRRSWHNKSK
jgi:hypothetical protein